MPCASGPEVQETSFLNSWKLSTNDRSACDSTSWYHSWPSGYSAPAVATGVMPLATNASIAEVSSALVVGTGMPFAANMSLL